MAELAYGNPINTTALARDLGRYRVDVEAELDRYAAGGTRQARPMGIAGSGKDAAVIDLNRWRDR